MSQCSLLKGVALEKDKLLKSRNEWFITSSVAVYTIYTLLRFFKSNEKIFRKKDHIWI